MAMVGNGFGYISMIGNRCQWSTDVNGWKAVQPIGWWVAEMGAKC
jgi:hypothetical protein